MKLGTAVQRLGPEDYYKVFCVHQLFEMQARRSPRACAVIFKNERVCYRDLNRRANHLAWKLIELGVTPDEIVGICADRSIETIVGMLAVLKAGAAWLPLEPRYPKERLTFMLRDAHVRFLLVDQFAERLSDDGVTVVELAYSNISDMPDPSLSLSPSNLAYVIYTSGSTGKPKGVEVPHRGIVRLLFGVDYVSLDSTKILLQISSLTADLSVFDIWAALLHGGQIVLYPGRLPVVPELGELLHEHKVTTVLLPTALFNAIVDEDPSVLATLKQILVAGEAMSVSHVRRAWDLLPGVEIINAYGPTEAAVLACSHPILARPAETDTSIPIGRPISNTQTYILDENCKPVSSQIIGELYLGGAGIARGYRNQPELTTQRFIPDPFVKGSVLYKTGDLARYGQDGTIEFLGRIDNQIKIRGFRVELGEIEEVSRRHESVRDAVVTANLNVTGERFLSAFVLSKPQSKLSADEMLVFLQERLPEFMVPAHCHIMDRWPLTSNGKVDRQALAALGSMACNQFDECVTARTQLEDQLAQIWEQLLNVRPIGVHDNFFDLGGTSLLAMRFMAKIEKLFDKRLSAAILLSAPTIERFAVCLMSTESEKRLTYRIPIQSKGEEPPFFCLGAGSLFRPLAALLGPRQPFFSIGLDPIAVEQLTKFCGLEELARHLVVAVREKQPQGPYYLGGWCQDGLFALEVAQQLIGQNQEVGLLVLFETENPSAQTQKRILTKLRHAALRIRYLLRQVRRLKIKRALGYIHNCLAETDLFVKQSWWRLTRHVSRFVLVSPHNLKQMLYLAAISYEPQPLKCPTILFTAKEWSAGDRYLGWRELLAGRHEVYEVPGDHAGIFSEPNVEVLASLMRMCLENARRAYESPQKAGSSVINYNGDS